MNTLDKEIMMALLGSQPSMYGLEKSLHGRNYPTVRRHIKKMKKMVFSLLQKLLERMENKT